MGNLKKYNLFGSRIGAPDTQLCISNMPNIYGNESEIIFWRINKKKGKFYISLSQYSPTGNIYLTEKLKRLIKLRLIAIEITTEYPLLKMGKLSDKGTKESEIIIFFLEDNDLKILFEALPKFSLKFNKMYEKEL